MTEWNDKVPKDQWPKPEPTTYSAMPYRPPIAKKIIIADTMWDADKEARIRSIRGADWQFVHPASGGVALRGLKSGHVIVARGTKSVGSTVRLILKELTRQEHVLIEGLDHIRGWR